MRENKEQKKNFSSWLVTHDRRIDLAKSEKLSNSFIVEEGNANATIYDYSNASAVRLLLSKAAIKRHKFKNFNDYEAVISLCLLYSEFLAEQELSDSITDVQTLWDAVNEKKVANVIHNDKTKDSLTVAYYLSRMNKAAVHHLGYKSFREAFDKIAKLLDQKPSTIKNMRDEYDPYFDNGRVGWYQRSLSPSRMEVFKKYEDIPDDALEKIVDEIIASYMEDYIGNNGHKKIIISTGAMKEVKAKHK